MPRYQRDPVKIELLKNALTAIADEMAITVVRTARSFVIKESLDFSTGLMDADGALIAQGLCLPLHMGSFPPTMKSILRDYGQELRPGDVYATNDPYLGGGTHLPDIYVFKPIFLDGNCSDSRPPSDTRRTSADGWRAEMRATTWRSTRRG